MRIQPRTKTPRDPVHSATHHKVNQWVEREAARFNCSKSWVINVALAYVAQIELFPEERYDYDPRRRRARRAA